MRTSFVWTSMPKNISVSGNLSQIMKLCVNLNSAIQRWSTVIPDAVIGNPSAVFSVVVVSWIGVLKLGEPYNISGMDYYCWTVHDECYCDKVLCS